MVKGSPGVGLEGSGAPAVPRHVDPGFRRRILWGLIILGVVWAGLAVTFGFTDLQISKAVYNPTSATAHFFEKYGGYPGPTIIILSLLIYATNLPAAPRWKFRLRAGGALVGSTAASYYMLSKILGFWSGLAGLALTTTIAVGLGLLAFWSVVLAVLRRRATDFARRYAVVPKVIIRLTFVVAFAVIQILKSFWGRSSYRNLGPDQAGYSPWYFPQGFNEDRAFPSGHVVMAWMLLVLIILARYAPRAIRAVCWAVPFVWGTIVGYQRIVAGAHYASDVLFGIGFTILGFLLFYRRYGPPLPPGGSAKKARLEGDHGYAA